MAAATSASELDFYKLETEIGDDYVIHSTYKPGTKVQQRKAILETKWTDKEKLGQGGSGDVMLQEDGAGNLRAVKRIQRRQHRVYYSRELEALASLRNVRTHRIRKVECLFTNGKYHERRDLFVLFLGWYEDKNFSLHRNGVHRAW